jgi:hypothetical protein
MPRMSQNTPACRQGRPPARVRRALTIVLLLASCWSAAARPALADSSIGFGLHSWRTVDDLRSEGFGDLSRSGESYLVSYLYSPGALLKFELDGEYFPKGFGGSAHYAISPQAFVLVGGFVYGGLGIGTIYSRDFANDFSSPYYTARVGINFHLLPRLTLDVNGNYIFHAFNELRGANTGTATLGAIARIGL